MLQPPDRENQQREHRPRQQAIPGLAGGVVLDLLDPVWFARVDVDVEPIDNQPSEAQEIAQDLQLKLGERVKHKCPSIEDLNTLGRDVSRRAYIEHPEGLEFVADYTEDELNERLHGIHRRLYRGLSALDAAIMREWKARASGFGVFYGKQHPHLPSQFLHLAGRRAPARQKVLAILMLAMVHGTNSLNLSAPEAFKLFDIPGSTWWNCIAWLERADLFRRFHSHKDNRKAQKSHHAGEKKGPRPASVQFSDNCYIPTPRLLAMRPAILAAFKVAGAEANEAARLELVEQCKARARQQRADARDRKRREQGQLPFMVPGQDAPAWALSLIDVAWLSAIEAKAGRRAEAWWYGWADVDALQLGATLLPEYALDPDQLGELEHLVDVDVDGRHVASIGRHAADPQLEHPEAARIELRIPELQPDAIEHPEAEYRYGLGVLPTLSRPSRRPARGTWRVSDTLPGAGAPVDVDAAPARPGGPCAGGLSTPPRAVQLPSKEWTDVPFEKRTERKQARGGVDRPPAHGPPGRAGAASTSTGAPAPVTATAAAHDGWGRQDWTERTQHDCPLATWADGTNEPAQPSDTGGGRALAPRQRKTEPDLADVVRPVFEAPTCPLCGGDEFEPAPHALIKCRRCGVPLMPG